MDIRIRDRRRVVARERGQRRFAVLAVIVLVAAIAGGFLWLRGSESFLVARVVPVTERIPPDQIAAAVAPARGVNLLKVSLDELQERLAAIPYVRTAQVHRRFPDAVEVRLEEYVPFAVVRGRDGGRWLVGDDGRVLEPAQGASDLAYLTSEAEVWPEEGGVVDPYVAAALPLVAVLADPSVWPANHPVDRIQIGRMGDATIVLAGGGQVRLGEPIQLKEKLTVALAIIDQYLREGRSLAYVDVGEPTRAVARSR
jgi:cell division protein FtsQ